MHRMEEKIAHLERALDDLSDVVARQQTEIASLIRQVARLTARDAENDADGRSHVVLGDERPPHY